MTHLETSQDEQYRQDIANLILAELRADTNQQFGTQNGFAAWARGEKTLLRGLFGGQGIQRLARVVAWHRREQTQRRKPAEMLCYFADLFRNGRMAHDEPILCERWTCLNDVLRACLLDKSVADVLFMPMGESLPSLARTTLIVLT